jgi:hypothetical protein
MLPTLKRASARGASTGRPGAGRDAASFESGSVDAAAPRDRFGHRAVAPPARVSHSHGCESGTPYRSHVRLSHEPPASSLDPFQGRAPKTAKSFVTRHPRLATRPRSAAVAPTSASEQRSFRSGFMRQPHVYARASCEPGRTVTRPRRASWSGRRGRSLVGRMRWSETWIALRGRRFGVRPAPSARRPALERVSVASVGVVA